MRQVLLVIPCLVGTVLGTNPTHYGNPTGGCESDEKAIQVQGVPGDFCSPVCKSGACPSDEPSDATAKPQCALSTPTGDKYCALICQPSVIAPNGANGECGSGTCQSIQGVGLCTYAASNAVAEVTAALANPTHYGNPTGGCESDEKAIQVQGVPGDFCAPVCKSGACPSDEPAGVSAKPQCALSSPTGDKYCALICQPSAIAPNGANGECGSGTCQSIQGVGLCTYAASNAVAEVTASFASLADNTLIV